MLLNELAFDRSGAVQDLKHKMMSIVDKQPNAPSPIHKMQNTCKKYCSRKSKKIRGKD